MLEIPESKTISLQVNNTIIGRRIIEVVNATSPHKFTWYNGDPFEYSKILVGRQIESTKGHGMFVDIHCDSNIGITIGDGTNIRYFSPVEKHPPKHQLLIVLDDGSFLVFTVAMYGGIWAYKGAFDNPYYRKSLNSISPLDDSFNESVFESIIKSVSKDISAKALLATEQRIPGVGNGVLQDILFNAGINPKRKKSSLSDFEVGELFHSMKVTLNSMTDKGGRDTERDLFGNSGGYKTKLSKKTLQNPCPNCGGIFKKEAYLGGAVYYCPSCQKI